MTLKKQNIDSQMKDTLSKILSLKLISPSMNCMNVFITGVLVKTYLIKKNIKEIKRSYICRIINDKVDQIEFKEAYHPLTSKNQNDTIKNNDVFKEIASSTYQFQTQTQLTFIL